jgi:hypothetical protein
MPLPQKWVVSGSDCCCIVSALGSSIEPSGSLEELGEAVGHALVAFVLSLHLCTFAPLHAFLEIDPSLGR